MEVRVQDIVSEPIEVVEAEEMDEDTLEKLEAEFLNETDGVSEASAPAKADDIDFGNEIDEIAKLSASAKENDNCIYFNEFDAEGAPNGAIRCKNHSKCSKCGWNPEVAKVRKAILEAEGAHALQ